MTNNQGGDGSAADFAGLSRRQRVLLMCNLVLVNFFASISFSILGPFFPREAELKGLSVTMTGVIVGEFEFILFVLSPVIGAFLSHAGTQFVYTWGLVICSVCSALFGSLEFCPPGNTFAIMCLATRGVCAVGTAMFVVSSFSIATRAFPSRVSTVFGILETSSGVGFMIGPVLGGVLYQVGGFKLPFMSVGGVLLVVALVSMFFMPDLDSRIGDEESNTGSSLGLLKLPFTMATLFGLCAVSSFLSFMDISIQPFLSSQFNFSPVAVGLTLFLPSSLYAASAGIWGWLVDTKGVGLIVMPIGTLLFGISLVFVYPAPFIPYSPNLVSLYSALVVVGLSCPAVLVPVFSLLTTEAYRHSYPQNLATYSLVSGLVNSAFSFGAFVGPTAGGVALDLFGLAWVLTGYSGLFIVAAMLLLLPTYINGGFLQQPAGASPLLADTDSNEAEVRQSYGAVNA